MLNVIRKATSKVTGRYWTLPATSDGDERFYEGGIRLKNHNLNKFNTNSPLFSIVTIAYNNQNCIERCVESILKQTYPFVEHIIIDGGSKDGTIEILKGYSDKIDYFVSEKDFGIYNALNKGLSLCQGEFIALIHADDFFFHNAIELAFKTISKTNCDIALGDSIYVDNNKYVAYKPARNYGAETILRGIIGPHEAAFVSSYAYNRVGCYDESYKIAADFKFFRNCLLKGIKFSKIGQAVNYKEIGGDSFDKKIEYEENERLLKEIFPSLRPDECKLLYKLKNYYNTTSNDYINLYKYLQTPAIKPNNLYKVITLSLLSKKLGDSADSSFSCDRGKHIEKLLSPSSKKSIFLCIGKLKNTAGGAERVLVELANNLSKNHYDVHIACADGRPGIPFYKLESDISLFDINEQPLQNELTAESNSLIKEIESIIDKTPDELLKIVTLPITIRKKITKWNDCLEQEKNKIFRREDAISKLKVEASAWVKKYGNNVIRWRNFFSQKKPTVIIPFMISCIPQIYIATRNQNSKLFLSNHNNSIRDYYNQDEWDSSGLDRLLRLFSVASTAKSHWLLPEYVKNLPPRCRKNAVVIENPITPPDSYGEFCQREKIILAVGRLTEVKNFQLLIRAFAHISEHHSDWIVKIIGDGPLKSELEYLIKKLGVKSKVKLCGITSYIHEEYNKASIFVSTSLVEGFPLTLCEALSYGVPCIGRLACSGVNSIIKQDYNGLLLNVCDNEEYELSRVIKRIIVDEDLRKRLSICAVESVKAFSPDKIYRKWNTEIGSLVYGNLKGSCWIPES